MQASMNAKRDGLHPLQLDYKDAGVCHWHAWHAELHLCFGPIVFTACTANL